MRGLVWSFISVGSRSVEASVSCILYNVIDNARAPRAREVDYVSQQFRCSSSI